MPSRKIRPADGQREFVFDRRDRFRFLRGADFGNPAELGRKNFAPLKRLIEIIETKTAADDSTYLTQTEIGHIWGVSRQTVNAWIQTGVALGVLCVAHRVERGGQRSNRMSVDWEAVRRFAYGGEANRAAAGHFTPVSNDSTPVLNHLTPHKESVRLKRPANLPPIPPSKRTTFDGSAFGAAAGELFELGVRNVTRTIQAAKRRQMTPGDVAAVLTEFRERRGRGEFTDPPAALVARLVDLDEFPPPSPEARRRVADAARTRQAAAQRRQRDANARAAAQRRQRAAEAPRFDELPAAEQARRIEETRKQFPGNPPRMVRQFAAAAYHTEVERV